MKNTMKCPYDPNVICSYVEQLSRDSVNHECCDCPHYVPPSSKDTIDGVKTVGCLIAGIIMLIIGLFVAGWIIQSLRQ
jgi:hypothetical protein